jgi:hypothetical protein
MNHYASYWKSWLGRHPACVSVLTRLVVKQPVWPASWLNACLGPGYHGSFCRQLRGPLCYRLHVVDLFGTPGGIVAGSSLDKCLYRNVATRAGYVPLRQRRLLMPIAVPGWPLHARHRYLHENFLRLGIVSDASPWSLRLNQSKKKIGPQTLGPEWQTQPRERAGRVNGQMKA